MECPANANRGGAADNTRSAMALIEDNPPNDTT
jgi:hypothetical protein